MLKALALPDDVWLVQYLSAQHCACFDEKCNMPMRIFWTSCDILREWVFSPLSSDGCGRDTDDTHGSLPFNHFLPPPRQYSPAKQRSSRHFPPPSTAPDHLSHSPLHNQILLPVAARRHLSLCVFLGVPELLARTRNH